MANLRHQLIFESLKVTIVIILEKTLIRKDYIDVLNKLIYAVF